MKWINQYWAKAGGIIAAIILVSVVFRYPELTPTRILLWLHLAVLFMHQFEEYVYPGGFKTFFNEKIAGRNPVMRKPLSDQAILAVNIPMAWGAYILSAIFFRWEWLATGLALITIMNGVLHTMMAIIHKEYNPGLITGLVLCIPLGLFLLIHLEASNQMQTWLAGLGIFLTGTASVPLLIYIFRSSQQKSS